MDSDWTGDDFRREVVAWTTSRLAEEGTTATGEWAQPHARPWSSTMSFETDRGRVWFKVNGAGTRAEPVLTAWLSRVCPSLVVEVLAVDPDRGWWLSRDAGPTLRTALSAEQGWPVWVELIARYAEAQIELAARREEARATGLRDVDPVDGPTAMRELVAELSDRPVAEGGLDRDETAALTALLPSLEGWFGELATSRVPDSVQHDDLHGNNVGWTGAAATARILDWGDASWGFPLATMLATTRSLAHHAGLEEDSAPVRRVVDAYLEPFTSYDDRGSLEHLLDLSMRTGRLTRALAWRAALQEVEPSHQGQHDFPVRAWLLDLLDG